MGFSSDIILNNASLKEQSYVLFCFNRIILLQFLFRDSEGGMLSFVLLLFIKII